VPEEQQRAANGRFTSSNIPVPDPTLLTIDLTDREIAHLREFLTARIIGVERLCEEKLAGIERQLIERDTRVSYAQSSNEKAIAAALAAQKEAVKENQLSTKEQIGGLSMAAAARDKAVEQQINDLKDRIGVTTVQVGTGEGAQVGRERLVATMIAAAGVLVAVIAIAVGAIISSR